MTVQFIIFDYITYVSNMGGTVVKAGSLLV